VCLLHQDGGDGYISPERRFDLQAHVVGRIFQADSSPFVLGVGPVSADQHQHKVAGSRRFLQYSAEITTQSDAVHIHEDGIFAQPRCEVIE